MQEENRAGDRPTLSRRKARRKAFELLFELEVRSSATIEELLERTFNLENWLQKSGTDEKSAQELQAALSNPEDDEDEPILGEFGKNNEDFIRKICTLVAENIGLLDSILAEYPEEWRFERIGLPEKSILRMALAELIFMDTPVKVVINEALDLTKIYGEHDSNKFLNGILGAIARNLDEVRQKHRAAKSEI